MEEKEYKPAEYNVQFKGLQYLRRASSEQGVLSLLIKQSHLYKWIRFSPLLLWQFHGSHPAKAEGEVPLFSSTKDFSVGEY